MIMSYLLELVLSISNIHVSLEIVRDNIQSHKM